MELLRGMLGRKTGNNPDHELVRWAGRQGTPRLLSRIKIRKATGTEGSGARGFSAVMPGGQMGRLPEDLVGLREPVHERHGQIEGRPIGVETSAATATSKLSRSNRPFRPYRTTWWLPARRTCTGASPPQDSSNRGDSPLGSLHPAFSMMVVVGIGRGAVASRGTGQGVFPVESLSGGGLGLQVSYQGGHIPRAET